MSEEKFYSAKQAAAYIGVHEQTMKRWLKLGKAVPVFRRANIAVFSQSQVDEMKSEREANPEKRGRKKREVK